MPNLTERRRDPLAGDRQIKKIIVGTICTVVFMTVATICALALRAMEIPDQLDRLATFVLGGVMAMLAKTGMDQLMKQPVEVTAPPGEPLPVTTEEPMPENAS